MNFVVNDVPYRSNTGFTAIKNRFGRDAVLSRMTTPGNRTYMLDADTGGSSDMTAAPSAAQDRSKEQRREQDGSSLARHQSPNNANKKQGTTTNEDSSNTTPYSASLSVTSHTTTGGVHDTNRPSIVICAVNRDGLFRVEEGQHYRVCALYSNSPRNTTLYDPAATPQDGRTTVKSEWCDNDCMDSTLLQRRHQRESRRARRERLRQLRGEFGSQAAPPRPRAQNRYSIFTGKFLATFEHTSFADAAREWHSFTPEERRGSSPDELVRILTTERNYLFARH